MRSAWRTVEKRCEMRIVVQCRVAARMRSKISASPRTSSCAVGSSSSTTPAPELHRAQRAGERDALPLAAGEVGAAVVAAREHRVEAGEVRRRPPPASAARTTSSGAPAGATLSRSGSSKRMKSWNTAVTRARHDGEIEVAQVDAVDLDRARLRVVEPAQQLGERGLAGAVLADDGERRAGGDREVEVRRAPGGRRRRDRRSVTSRKRISRAGMPRARSRARTASAPAGRHRRLEPQHRGDRRRRAVERPVEPAEGDHRRADGALRVDDDLRRG